MANEPKRSITIELAEYERLVARDDKLSRLESAGVDNWEGYADAIAEDAEDAEDGDGDGE